MPPAIISNDQLLRERLEDATSSTNKHNNWPDRLEVVSLKVYDPTSPADMHHLGYLVGNATVSRQISYKVFSYKAAGYDNDDKPLVEIRRHLPAPSYGHYSDSSFLRVQFGFVGPHGQEDDIVKRNINVIFDAPTHYNSVFQRQDFVSHGLVVTIGCKHDYDDSGSNHNRGYHLGKCRKCSHTYMVDSSD